jgi:hypothetical protein
VYLGETGEGRDWIYLLTSCTTDGYCEHGIETSGSIKCGEFFFDCRASQEGSSFVVFLNVTD